MPQAHLVERLVSEIGKAKRRGASVSGLAKAAAVNKGSLSRFLRGTRRLPVEAVERLLGVLGLRVVVRKEKRKKVAGRTG